MTPEQRIQALHSLVDETEASALENDFFTCSLRLDEMREHLQELEKFFNTKVIEHETE